MDGSGTWAKSRRPSEVLRYKLQGADDQIEDGEAKRKGPDCSGPFLPKCWCQLLEAVLQAELHDARQSQQTIVIAKRVRRVEREVQALHVKAIHVEYVKHVGLEAQSVVLVIRHLPDFPKLHIRVQESISAERIPRAGLTRKGNADVIKHSARIVEYTVRTGESARIHDVVVAAADLHAGNSKTRELPVGREAETCSGANREAAGPACDARELPAAYNRI